MNTEKEKMLAGELFDPQDKALSEERLQARLLLKKINDTPENEKKLRLRLLKQLIPQAKAALWIQPPFECDYGSNIITGENVFFNFNCIVLDVATVTIGNRVFIGPQVQLYTVLHPEDHELRASGKCYAKPITIGDDVWIGGNSVICPGITVGNRSIIGAGSVVTKNIPDDVFAAGNPCRVIRPVKKDHDKQQL